MAPTDPAARNPDPGTEASCGIATRPVVALGGGAMLRATGANAFERTGACTLSRSSTDGRSHASTVKAKVLP